MKTVSRVLAAASALSMLAAIPAPAQAQEYDTAVHSLLLDCTALQILFASASDKEADKTQSANAAAAFLTAANIMSGSEIKDLGAEIKPRREKIMGWITKNDPAATRLTKSCASIITVGRNAPAK
ncbi:MULTISPECIES: hypothetical protein [unclassified Novosphingobium]|uniref:hypothetical protein n=1 Tax=unclassified Novosphingobium TaxID=2644732 RepID=UPI0025CBF6E9|nr:MULTISPECIES: hypothetical protein [unclassified Novosphingobium]HQV02761.1 hypothetical protein [Novosphingobium sp.]